MHIGEERGKRRQGGRGEEEKRERGEEESRGEKRREEKRREENRREENRREQKRRGEERREEKRVCAFVSVDLSACLPVWARVCVCVRVCVRELQVWKKAISNLMELPLSSFIR